jgi:hypothetical protein
MPPSSSEDESDDAETGQDEDDDEEVEEVYRYTLLSRTSISLAHSNHNQESVSQEESNEESSVSASPRSKKQSVGRISSPAEEEPFQVIFVVPFKIL